MSSSFRAGFKGFFIAKNRLNRISYPSTSGVSSNTCAARCVRLDSSLVLFFPVNTAMGTEMAITRTTTTTVPIIITFLFILMMVNLKRNTEGCTEVGHKIMTRLACTNVVSQLFIKFIFFFLIFTFLARSLVDSNKAQCNN